MEQIDTIDVETGNISKNSVLNLVVFGDKDEHLDLLEGVLIDLLKTKWNTFVKAKFYKQFCMFSVYFLISLAAFTTRPRLMDDVSDGQENFRNATDQELFGADKNISDLPNSANSVLYNNNSLFLCNYTDILGEIRLNQSLEMNMEDDGNSTSNSFASFSECPLLDISTLERRVSYLKN